MFDSLTLELMDNIQNKASRIKNIRFSETKYSYDINSTIEIVSYKCIKELQKENIKINTDIRDAVKVFSTLPMTDREFLNIINHYKSDFEVIAKLYYTTPVIVKCRYRLALLRKRKLLQQAKKNIGQLTKKKSI